MSRRVQALFVLVIAAASFGLWVFSSQAAPNAVFQRSDLTGKTVLVQADAGIVHLLEHAHFEVVSGNKVFLIGKASADKNLVQEIRPGRTVWISVDNIREITEFTSNDLEKLPPKPNN